MASSPFSRLQVPWPVLNLIFVTGTARSRRVFWGLTGTQKPLEDLEQDFSVGSLLTRRTESSSWGQIRLAWCLYSP